MKHGWEYTTFENVIKPAKVDRCKDRTDLPILSITMRSGIVFQNDRFQKTIASKDTSDYKIVKDGQLVIAFPIDEGLIYTQDVADEGIMSPAYNIWDVDYSCLNRKFLNLYFHCPWAMNYYKSKLRGTTQRRRMIPKEDLLAMPIPIPPLPIQERIVSELDCINGILEKKREQIKELDALAQSIFYDMFGDPIQNERGWEVKKLSSVVDEQCPISYGIVQPMDDVKDGVPIVRPVDLIDTFVYRNGLKKTAQEISDSYKRTILRGDEILMCVRGTTGIVSLASNELKGCNTTRGIVPLYFAEMNRWFMFYLFKSPAMIGVIADNTYGIALKQINIKELRNLPIICPPLPLQQAFAAKIEAIEKQKELVKRSIAETETLLASRMQHYFEA